MRKANIIATAVLIASLCIVTASSLPRAYAAAQPSSGDRATTSFTDQLRGSDGKSYKVLGSSRNILYGKNGRISYNTYPSKLTMKHFRVKTAGKGPYDAYCIEWGIAFHDNRSYTSSWAGTDGYFKALPAKARAGITMASLYGRQPGKKVPVAGCNADDWYFATQCIIWEYQQKIRTSPTVIRGRTGMPANYFSRQMSGRPASKCYRYMLAKMADYKKIPSFSAASASAAMIHMLKHDNVSGKFTALLTDKNKTGKIPAQPRNGISQTVSGSRYLYSTSSQLKSTVVVRTTDVSNVTHKLLCWGGTAGGQALITGAGDSVVYYTAFRTEAEGKLKLVKTSEDGIVSDIGFTITGSGITPLKVRTDSSGLIEADLYPGTYTVTEDFSDKYINTGSKEVIIKENQTTEVSFENRLTPGGVQITKKDVADGELLPDCGIEILDADKNIIVKGKTDDNGIFRFDTLLPGKYFFREYDAPGGYELDEKPHQFEVGSGGRIVKCELTDKKTPVPPDKPGKTAAVEEKSVKTGDNREAAFWLAVMFMALIAAGITLIKARK